MKFTCSTREIASAVGAASKVVNAHTTVPILSNVLLSTQDAGIRVRATDLEITLEHGFAAEVTEPALEWAMAQSEPAQRAMAIAANHLMQHVHDMSDIIQRARCQK